MQKGISNLNGVKKLYQEIILDHAKNPETKVSAMDIITMRKHIILYAEIKYIFI